MWKRLSSAWSPPHTVSVPHSQSSSQRHSKVWLCEHHLGCPGKGGLCQRMGGRVTYRGASTSSLGLCLVSPSHEQLRTASGSEGTERKSLCLFTSCKEHLTLSWVQRKCISCPNVFQLVASFPFDSLLTRCYARHFSFFPSTWLCSCLLEKLRLFTLQEERLDASSVCCVYLLISVVWGVRDECAHSWLFSWSTLVSLWAAPWGHWGPAPWLGWMDKARFTSCFYLLCDRRKLTLWAYNFVYKMGTIIPASQDCKDDMILHAWITGKTLLSWKADPDLCKRKTIPPGILYHLCFIPHSRSSNHKPKAIGSVLSGRPCFVL